MKKAILGKVLEVTPFPVHVSVAGSRICGYEDKDSDWDILVIFEGHPEYDKIFSTERFIVDKEEVSLRFERIDFVKEQIINANIKLFEKMHSPYIFYSTFKGRNLMESAKQMDNTLLIHNYLKRIKNDIKFYLEKGYDKAIIYAYRRSLTVLGLLEFGSCILDYKTLSSLYPNTQMEKLANCKIRQTKVTDSNQIIKEIETFLDDIQKQSLFLNRKKHQCE